MDNQQQELDQSLSKALEASTAQLWEETNGMDVDTKMAAILSANKKHEADLEKYLNIVKEANSVVERCIKVNQTQKTDKFEYEIFLKLKSCTKP